MVSKSRDEPELRAGPQGHERPGYPHDDAHALALRGEREHLQDAEGQELAAGAPQLHGAQVSADQREADALRPLHQGHLGETRDA